MKFAIVSIDYQAARSSAPCLFGIEGTPETLAEWKAKGGTTMEMLTRTECEARGIATGPAFVAAQAAVDAPTGV